MSVNVLISLKATNTLLCISPAGATQKPEKTR